MVGETYAELEEQLTLEPFKPFDPLNGEPT